ncbi:AbrB/MazE/SpoVT family DNA-binding domain-containing protein [Botrimarina sp.]|uniref:AbrB/MazE/SpoVT family DNA-binding domain-containing protein n=1 Tax=Botrimarina sp. TaxID=2795802 RepID=UPI0032F02CD9
MRVDLVAIGNSQGIRIPKAVIDQAGLSKELELEVTPGAIVIRPAHRVRGGWADAAASCGVSAEDDLGDWDATLGDFQGVWE